MSRQDSQEASTPANHGAVVVVRHGETIWSRAGRHTGRTDLGLTDHGRAVAQRLSTELAGRDYEMVLTSPLRRARETCDLAGFGGRAVVDADLAEWDYGQYEGLTREEIERRSPGWEVFRDGCPGGESPVQVGERADRLVARLETADADVLVFAHSHLLRVLAARWIDLPVLGGRSLLLDAAGMGELGRHNGIPVIRRWNVRPGS